MILSKKKRNNQAIILMTISFRQQTGKKRSFHSVFGI